MTSTTKTVSKRSKNSGVLAAAGTPGDEAVCPSAASPASAVASCPETLAAGAAAGEAEAAAAAPAADATCAETAQTAGAAAEKTVENPIHAIIDSVSERIKSCMAQLKETDALLKQLTKDTKKLCKKRAPSGKPSNLTQPLGISKELSEFLAVAPETTITRSAVTKAINEYAVANGLKLPGNGRIIKLDDRLAALLSKSNGFEIPIINVQTHLREHYVKIAPAVAPAVAAE